MSCREWPIGFWPTTEWPEAEWPFCNELVNDFCTYNLGTTTLNYFYASPTNIEKTYEQSADLETLNSSITDINSKLTFNPNLVYANSTLANIISNCSQTENLQQNLTVSADIIQVPHFSTEIEFITNIPTNVNKTTTFDDTILQNFSSHIDLCGCEDC